MISIENIEKKFGNIEVLKKINLEIKSGRVTAIVGPNGSGKTTLIKSVLGLVKPDSGKIFVDGKLVNGDYSYKNQIGYMPQIARYPENLKVNEVINMIKDLRNSDVEINPELLETFNLYKEMNKPFRALSGGTRQKVSVLIAFMFDPQILILDEPTSGLDPVSSSYFKELVSKEKQKGKTIILTSHIMSEIQELSDSIVFLLEGKIHFQGSINALLADQEEDKLERAIARMMAEANV